ncbi:hypothetical protein F2Q69_00019609 [Brassica cretica]|uniref:Uncharacterized protein n=1 Tax=Brassica cretica TaxID=69181 RepID=A0A8S9Q837_BRACR|nr:hypothetical protein F2Q69_00019609 [Brassica cretica]
MMRPETTDFAEITESVNLIPLNLLAFTNTNTYLPDIVGQLTGIKSTFSEEAHSKGRVMATIKIQRLSLILISKRMYRVGFVCSMQWLLHFLKITELRPRPKGYCVNPKIVGARSLTAQQSEIESQQVDKDALEAFAAGTVCWSNKASKAWIPHWAGDT